MKYLNINQNKMKIILSSGELVALGLEGARDTPDTPRHRRTFRRLLEAAERECGFSVSGERILIQLYPTDDGGELLVTRLGTLSAIAEKSLVASPSVALVSIRKEVYLFPEIDSLLYAARRLAALPEAVDGEVYFSDGGEYYLVLDDGWCDGIRLPLSEFAQRLSHTVYPYVREHMHKVKCEGVISRLAEL